MISFTLTEEQVEKYNQWRIRELKEVKPDSLGVREAFVFIPHTAGMAIKVVCGDLQLDLTDYENIGN